MASSAKEYFDFLMGQPDKYGYLAGLPNTTEHVFEQEWLEFKSHFPQEEKKSLRGHWSECLSAFANTEGGVLVWGVSAKRKPGTTRDCVTGLDEVVRPDEWRQKLKDWLLQAADPPVGGVIMEVIRHPTEDKGFVVCLIPEGQVKPHRAEFADNKPYLIRVGDSNVVPSGSLLRSLFYPQPRKELILEATSEWQTGWKGLDTPRRAISRVSIRNVGNTSARDVAARFITSVDATFDFTDFVIGNSSTFVREETCIFRDTLHPGQSVFIGYIKSEELSFRFKLLLYQADCKPMGGWVAIDPVRNPPAKVKLGPFDCELDFGPE